MRRTLPLRKRCVFLRPELASILLLEQSEKASAKSTCYYKRCTVPFALPLKVFLSQPPFAPSNKNFHPLSASFLPSSFLAADFGPLRLVSFLPPSPPSNPGDFFLPPSASSCTFSSRACAVTPADCRLPCVRACVDGGGGGGRKDLTGEDGKRRRRRR